MMYKHAWWRWKNVVVSSVLLAIPMVMCAMEQEEEIKINDMNLIEASLNGHKEVVDSLIKEGANINAVAMYDDTALILASRYSHKEVVESLIRAGVNINAVNNYGWTALMEASFKGHKEVVKNLIKGGAYINAVSNNGWTALMEASRSGHKEVVERLIKEGAYINAVNNYGYTALMWASVNGYKEIVESLIKGGSNPYAKNNDGKNTLDLAKNEELKKHIIKKRNEYVIKKYKEYLIDGKNRMENLAALLQKEYDWYNPYWNEDKSEHDEHNLQEVKQSYSFPKDIAGVIARMRYGISDDEWAQMRRLENEQQSLKRILVVLNNL